MTQDEATRPWGFGLLAIAAITFFALTMMAVLLLRWLGTDHQAPGASGVARPGEESVAGQTQPGPPAQPPSVEGVRERRQGAVGSSRQDGGDRAAPGADDGRRGREPSPSAPGKAGWPADASRREPGAPISPGGIDSTSRAAPAAAAAAPSQGSSVPILHAPSSGAGAPTVPSSGPQTVGAVSVQNAGATPPQEGPAPPPEDDRPGEPKSPAEVKDGSDRTPPLLEGIRFDPSTVAGGGVTTLTIQASDDLSGVRSVRGEIQSPSGSAVLPIWQQYGHGGDTFTYTIKIPREAETGVWYVRWLSLTDLADNASLVQALSASEAPRGGTFFVHSLESDSTAPEVRRILFDKTTVSDEEKVVISVEARDDSSGIASITGACQNPSKSGLIWFRCALNPESELWEGDVVLPKDAECGQWAIQQISAKDKAGNTTFLTGDSPLLAGAGFQISGRPGCGSTAPTLDGFDLSPTVVPSETATEILVTAKVSYSGTGTVAMTGWFEGPIAEGGQAPKNHFHCAPDPADPAAPWTGKIQVPQFAAKGIWKVGVIRLEDNAGNFREYTAVDPVVSGRVFEVQ